MIPQEEMTATADRLTDALTAAAAIMPPDEARALSSPVPGRRVAGCETGPAPDGPPARVAGSRRRRGHRHRDHPDRRDPSR